MLRRRWLLLWLLLIVVGGTLSATLGYGLYLRSGWYARRVAGRLTAFFDLPTEVGSILPLDLYGRELRDVQVWLPGKRGRVFRGDRIIWQRVPGDDGEPGYELKIRGGAFRIDSDRWGAQDYRRVLDSGLGHDFARLGLRRVELTGVDLHWVDGDLSLVTRNANGQVIFDRAGIGQASLLSNWLNDHRVDEPIHIFARFRSSPGVHIERVTLDAPRIPLGALGLESLLGSDVLRGDFSGRITYLETEGGQRVEMRGDIDGLRLEDLSGALPVGGLRGRVAVRVDEGIIVNGRLVRLSFRGRIDDVVLAPIAELFSWPQVGGRAELFVHQGEIRDERIDWLSLSGSVEGLSLEVLARLVGEGCITGTLRVEIAGLVVRDGAIESVELRLIASPPDDEPGWISRELLTSFVERVAGLTLPDFLPDQIEYTQLGARVMIGGDEIRVLGTHGTRNTTILTVKAFGRELGVLFQPSRTFELGPVLDRIRAEADRLNTEKLRDWLHTHPGFIPPADEPAFP